MRRRSPRSSSQVPRDLVQVFVERAPLPPLDLGEPVQDRADVEAHAEGHLHHALLVDRLELPHGHGHAVRLDEGPRISDGDEALPVRRELAERLVGSVAERAEVHAEPLPRPRMQPGVIDVPIEEALLQRFRGLRRTGIGEGVVRQPVLAPGHELLVRQRVSERVQLAVLRDPDEEMPALLAHLEEPLHHGELLRELGQRAVDGDDAILEVVREVDRGLSFDQPAVFIHHVPRLLLPSFLREFEQGAMQFVLGRDELLERRNADHALHKPPVFPPERMAIKRVPQEANGDEGEPPAREVQQERIGAIDRDHLPCGVGTLEGAEVRDFLRRQGHVPVVLHEELELPTHVVHVTHARTSARDSWFGVIVTRIRPGNLSATSARWVIRMTFSKTSPILRSFWTKSSRETSVSRAPRSPSSMNSVFMRPKVRPICGIDASSRAMANRKAALICCFSPLLNSRTSCHCPSTPWTRMRIPWPRPSSYVSRRIRPNRLSVSSERFFDASISSSGRS